MADTPSENRLDAYLMPYLNKDLLRFVAVGSVDDGKSTLIGRLLHDSGMLTDDQLSAVRQASALEGEEIDFSLFTDGLKAEREQGITIDVAYRYFSTGKRKFILADTPGHCQYTRNMVTGASTAHVALIVIDARLGVLQQSRRHATIASMLGIPHLAVCINKMDLVGYDQQVYTRILSEFSVFLAGLHFSEVQFFPISALKGDNIIARSAQMPWYEGEAVLGYMENVPLATEQNLCSFRFPVQTVIRPHLDYRGFAGKIVSGSIKKGDRVVALPSGQKSTILAIDTFGGTIPEAFCQQSVALRLEDEIDISRGDMLVKPEDLPCVGRRFEAMMVWMDETSLDMDKTYLIKHTTQTVRVQVEQVHWKKDMDTWSDVDTDTLSLNDIGRVALSCHRALFFDAYSSNRSTGAFILIDSLTNNTVAAGMMVGNGGQTLNEALRELRAGSGLKPQTQISPRERMGRLGQRGATVWLTGLPGSGRWSLAYGLERRLFDLGRTATVVKPVGEDLRSMISAANAVSDAGLIAICAFPTYTKHARSEVRERVGDTRFIEVYVNTDEALCRERRPDANFNGFEPPLQPDVTVALDRTRLDNAIELVVQALESRNQFQASDESGLERRE
ncbi:MAG: adenylyl-sulfate kinase [Myxococcales bacterium]|nr:adenylyl-sulfate kinase [Myxococcales bacterium]MCB9708168.1 adenylyl-sulfate kinase [Myxococcales bacterium]